MECEESSAELSQESCSLTVASKVPSAELGHGSGGLRAECKESSAELGQSCGGFSSAGLVHGITRGLVGQRRGGSGLWGEDGRGRGPKEVG